MNSMPEPTQDSIRINDSDDARLPGTVAELRAAAVAALEAWGPDSPEVAARLLQSWRRRPLPSRRWAEMTDADVTAVLDAMFPEPATPKPIAKHYETGGWKGDEPGSCGLECACGVTFDGFDSLAEAAEVMAHHITDGNAEESNLARKKADPAFRSGYAEGFLDAVRTRGRMMRDAAEVERLRQELIACPEWCTFDHSADDPADPIMNLILHMGDDQTDGVVRRMLLGETAGYTLDIRVARTDCPQEGTIGTPALLVRTDVEVTTWEQAAELARSILDGFGYLKGADQP